MIAENKKILLEHLYNLTLSKEINWNTEIVMSNERINLKSSFDKYTLNIGLSKEEDDRFSFYMSMWGDKEISDNFKSETVYLSNYRDNEHSKEFIDYVIKENNIDLSSISSDTIIDKFLEDTAKHILRDRKIDSLLND